MMYFLPIYFGMDILFPWAELLPHYSKDVNDEKSQRETQKKSKISLTNKNYPLFWT